MKTATRFRKRPYWVAVERCLAVFHHRALPEARSLIHAYRDRIRVLNDGSEPDILYHEEPFYLACDIANKDMDPEPIWDEYERLLAEVAKAHLPKKKGLAHA